MVDQHMAVIDELRYAMAGLSEGSDIGTFRDALTKADALVKAVEELSQESMYGGDYVEVYCERRLFKACFDAMEEYRKAREVQKGPVG